ncbi:helix-turn-helix domain-containing protein [Acrocarpospora macrocephala]|uniref:AraC family transcriptional regulator n=1 Tax=Acrocarpospora macrocephala TaxID=150177 RepID=A0A5M3X677_9ACTN|nr:AraC family transcriptional regulator [Acrocarpospora macrocephala]
MRVSEFSTDGLPAHDRLPGWIESVERSLTPSRVQSEQNDFRGWVRTVELDNVQVSTMAYPPLIVRRSAQHIRRSDPEAYQVNLILSGQGWTAQAGREAVISAGEFVLFDTSRTFEGRRICAPDTACGIVVEIPRALLPLPPTMVSLLVGASFSGRQGIGAMFRRWLTNLDRHATEFTAADEPSLSSITVELLVAVLSHQLDDAGATSPESHRRVLRVRVRDYVEQRLSDPNLSPTAIAAAHQISLRHLYQIFDDEDVTLSAWIRRQRLENCRRDLADPRLASRPVHAIASRWGFTDAAHFSRAFRNAYDMPPSVYRRLTLTDQPMQRSTSTVHK